MIQGTSLVCKVWIVPYEYVEMGMEKDHYRWVDHWYDINAIHGWGPTITDEFHGQMVIEVYGEQIITNLPFSIYAPILAGIKASLDDRHGRVSDFVTSPEVQEMIELAKRNTHSPN